MTTMFPAVDADTRRHVIEGVADTLKAYYVFPDLGQQMSDLLNTRLTTHAYDDLTTVEELCERLTDNLQAISRDHHLRVRYNEEPRPLSVPDSYSEEEIAEWVAIARSANYGFYKIERLDGNVGYLDLRNFWDPGWEGAGDAAVGAMALLAATDALIIDLRRNTGGTPSMVALISSYLLGAEPVHLNTIYDRISDKNFQSWSLPYVPGRRTPTKPVYVLTSKNTFSAAEEFTYNLKGLKRATIVGETTRGGAHPGRDISVTLHFRVFVPMGRPISPYTGGNWEGTGVEPDIAVTADAAFSHAYRLALTAVIDKFETSKGEALRNQTNEARTALAAIGV